MLTRYLFYEKDIQFDVINAANCCLIKEARFFASPKARTRKKNTLNFKFRTAHFPRIIWTARCIVPNNIVACIMILERLLRLVYFIDYLSPWL